MKPTVTIDATILRRLTELAAQMIEQREAAEIDEPQERIRDVHAVVQANRLLNPKP